jgi:hypothetical protein
MDLNLLLITLNILVLIIDIPFITTSCNCSYQHVNLFNEFDGKFGKLNNDECIARPSMNHGIFFYAYIYFINMLIYIFHLIIQLSCDI